MITNCISVDSEFRDVAISNIVNGLIDARKFLKNLREIELEQFTLYNKKLDVIEQVRLNDETVDVFYKQFLSNFENEIESTDKKNTPNVDIEQLLIELYDFYVKPYNRIMFQMIRSFLRTETFIFDELDEDAFHEFDIIQDDVVILYRKLKESEKYINNMPHVIEVVSKIKELESIRDQVEKIKKEVEIKSSAVSKIIKQIVENGFTGHYGGLARRHSWYSLGWLFLSISLIAGFIVYAYNALIVKDNLISAADIYHQIAFHLIVASMFYTCIFHSIRNSKIERHLHLLHQHMESTLISYKDVVASMNNEHGKMIAAQVYNTVFARYSNGYSELKGEEFSIPLIDVMKDVSKETVKKSPQTS
jgi:hypothetical protein